MGRGGLSGGGGNKRKHQIDRERFSVPLASRDQEILQYKYLRNENISELIKNPPQTRAVRIFENLEACDTSKGPIKAITTQGVTTIQRASGTLRKWNPLRSILDEKSATNNNNYTTRVLKALPAERDS